MTDMPRIKLPYVCRRRTRHGRVVFYYRNGGRYVRLPDISDPGFMDAYEAAKSGETRRRAPSGHNPGTLGWLIVTYQESQTFARLAESTRAARARILDRIRASAGASKISSVTPEAVIKGRDKRTAPEAANSFLKTLSALFSWAVEHGHAKRNPVSGVKRIRTGSKGHHTWTEDEIAAFRAQHPLGTNARTLMEIALGTGLRISDAAVLGRQHVRDGVVTIRTKKTGVTVSIPLMPELAEALAAVPQGQMLFVQTEAGHAFSIKSAGGWFRAKCDAAGVPGSAHGLRKAAATRLADAGASEHQLMAVLGWKDPKEAAVYTREANRKRLASSAIALISGAAPVHFENAERDTSTQGVPMEEKTSAKSNG